MLAMRRWSVRHAGLLEHVYAALAATLRALRPLAHAIGLARLEKPVATIERTVKSLLFDCKMCGGCVLGETGMSCPMNCPKQVRNGPCGGVRADGTCEANPAMLCVGLEGWLGGLRTVAGELPTAPTPPAEHNLAGTSAWLRRMNGESPLLAMQPKAPTISAGSRLEALLAQGTFVVTAEISPPDSADPADVLARVDPFRGCVDALNVTDASGANCHMSSLAVCVLLAQAGFEPVMQLACRDRNRIAIQGDILGAAALGVRNMLCLTGDHVGNGDHPGAKHVGDLDSVTLLATARKLRDAGEFLSGRKLLASPRLFLGAADNPSDASPAMRLARLRRKVAAGAKFVQTQYCFDLDALEHYMRMVRSEGLDQQVHILIGVGPVVSAKTARWMRAHVPGVRIPDAVVTRLEQAADPREEGRRICIEMIRAIGAIRGIAGVHLLAHKQEQLVRSIVNDSGVFAARLPRADTTQSALPLARLGP